MCQNLATVRASTHTVSAPAALKMILLRAIGRPDKEQSHNIAPASQAASWFDSWCSSWCSISEDVKEGLKLPSRWWPLWGFSCSSFDFPTHQGLSNSRYHPSGEVFHHWEDFDQVGARKSSTNDATHEVFDPSYERVILRLDRGPSIHCREQQFLKPH